MSVVIIIVNEYAKPIKNGVLTHFVTLIYFTDVSCSNELLNFKYHILLHGVNCHKFSGAFPKLQKVTVSFVMSVCPSICPRGTSWLLLDGF
jgi:hypothetical protein